VRYQKISDVLLDWKILLTLPFYLPRLFDLNEVFLSNLAEGDFDLFLSVHDIVAPHLNAVVPRLSGITDEYFMFSVLLEVMARTMKILIFSWHDWHRLFCG